MLVIRQAQIAVFEDRLRSQFESELVRHFVNLYPRETSEAGGEPQIARLVSRGMQRATQRGFDGRKEVGLFIASMFILGDSFDSDPQIPWAARQLNDAGTPLPLRPECVFDAAIAYLGATAGSSCEHLVRAMLRLRSFELDSAPDTDGDLWVDDCCELLHDYYPQKFDHQGDAANRALISLAQRNAASLGFTSNSGAALYAILMFMLGSGFDRDFLYPWAAAALADRSGEEERVGALHRAALNHLENSLTPDRP